MAKIVDGAYECTDKFACKDISGYNYLQGEVICVSDCGLNYHYTYAANDLRCTSTPSCTGV